MGNNLFADAKLVEAVLLPTPWNDPTYVVRIQWSYFVGQSVRGRMINKQLLLAVS